MNNNKIATWMVIGLVALAQFYMMIEPAVTFAGSGGGHTGG